MEQANVQNQTDFDVLIVGAGILGSEKPITCNNNVLIKAIASWK